jgi:hypothetical protein
MFSFDLEQQQADFHKGCWRWLQYRNYCFHSGDGLSKPFALCFADNARIASRLVSNTEKFELVRHGVVGNSLP